MKSGFVSIIGKPNVGKSTLLNNLLSFNLSITSSMAQTTRDKIKGIYFDEQKGQIVFTDTPGFHKVKNKLNHSMNEKVLDSFKKVDLVLFLVSIDQLDQGIDQELFSKLDLDKTILVLTKIDFVKRIEEIEEIAFNFKKMGFKNIVGVSDKMMDSYRVLINTIFNFLKEGPLHYDPEEITDVSMRFLAKEIIRKQIIKLTRDEIPHSVAVVIEEFIEPFSGEDQTIIRANIFVERDSQKGILIGHKGSVIKEIGINARKEINETLNIKCHLDLHVKVEKKWTNDPSKIKKMGY